MEKVKVCETVALPFFNHVAHQTCIREPLSNKGEMLRKGSDQSTVWDIVQSNNSIAICRSSCNCSSDNFLNASQIISQDYVCIPVSTDPHLPENVYALSSHKRPGGPKSHVTARAAGLLSTKFSK